MRDIGDPASERSDGSRIELRFENESGVFATVHTDCVKDYSLTKRSGAIDLLQLTLSGPRGAGLALLRDEATIEMWDHTAEGSDCIGLIRSEHVVGEIDEAGEHLRIQGRSPCGHLVDESLALQHTGSLRELILAMAPGEVDVSEGVPDASVSAYVSSPSTFGAMRLVATAMRLVVRDSGRSIAVTTREELLAQVRAKPVAKLTDSETLCANVA